VEVSIATMIGPLERATLVVYERVAVSCAGLELTYGETWERCRRLAGAMRELGLAAGDRVAVVGPNCHRYLEFELRGADGLPVAQGEVGEVLIRGANVMLGYWNKPEQTAAALTDGWYRTGDLGYMDDHAFLYLVDRAKDMIVSGGENVYSTEVEDLLYRHPAVLEAAVFGIPDPTWGEVVHAVVVPRAPVAEAELIAHCRTAIAGYKAPKRVDLRSEPLPKSGAGKVLKRELRAPYWEGRSTMVAGA
jgi:long-chain acyl-CoA synthetase